MTDTRALPTDGTPLCPAHALARWRDEAAATPLRYPDGHEGLIATRYEAVRRILEDPRFSQVPARLPGSGSVHGAEHAADDPGFEMPDYSATNLLALDGDEHLRARRAITARFSVRAALGGADAVSRIVRDAVERLREAGSPADLTAHFAEPISAANHCRVLGIPTPLQAEFSRLFVAGSSTGQKIGFVRALIDAKADDRGEDVVSDLLASRLPRNDVEGLLLVLMTSGRDSIAYMIATTTVALLERPDQLGRLRAQPELLVGAVEEFMRFGAMFVTLFPRTAIEDVEVEGVQIAAGRTVSVSPVAANRDPARFDDPDDFVVARDASGHLGFGHGIHGCVGQQVARVVIREAIGQLIEAFPGLRLVSAEQQRPMPFAHDVATYQAGEVVVAW
jgi:cytochrome P450